MVLVLHLREGDVVVEEELALGGEDRDRAEGSAGVRDQVQRGLLQLPLEQEDLEAVFEEGPEEHDQVHDHYDDQLDGEFDPLQLGRDLWR